MSEMILLAQRGDAEASVALAFMCCCYGGAILLSLAINVVTIAGMWAAFDKAGQPGWAVLIPIYNVIVWAEVARKEAWWGLLLLLPCVQIVFLFMLNIEIAKCFRKDAGYGVGLTLLPFVFWPMLGFGKATYLGEGQYAMPRSDAGGGWGKTSGKGW